MENILKIGLYCYGCKGCAQVCPKSCIFFEESDEGFLYPKIDEYKCINCGRCLQVCPVRIDSIHRSKPINTWAWKNKNEKDIMKSASGGAADSATKTMLKNGGIVFGAAYNKNLEVKHIEVSEEKDRYKLQSSKYVQSDTNNTFTKVKKRLLEGKKVLYSGTPCQIAGLYSYLGKEEENLYTIDLICHGVPSPKLFKKYIDYQEKKLGEKIISYNFRSKDKRGWGTQYMLKTKTKTKTKTLSLDKYGKHFISGDCYRECCYQCKYAHINRVGDLTVGDFWGIYKSHSKFASPKGVSCVLVNSEKGKKLFEEMRYYAEVEHATLKEIVDKQQNLVAPTKRPKNRNFFYNDINNKDFIKKISVGLQLKERIKAIIPIKIIRFFRQVLNR